MVTGDLVCWAFNRDEPLIFVSSYVPARNFYHFALVINAEGCIVEYWLNELELLHEAQSI